MNFDQLISKLLDEITVSNFNSVTLHELNEKSPEFWKNLLNYLKNEETKLGHNYIRTEDLTENNDDSSSIFGRINELADLNDSAITNYINSIKDKLADNATGVTSGTDYFWNESVSSLLSYVLLNFDNSIGDREIVSNIKVSDIKNANAGNSFNGGNWVKPWTNIDGSTYSDVRGTDKIESVLNNSAELQFTRTAGANKWLRLIMPKYTRAVEVEDLNRNFWVIAQVITAISAYLFDDDNPIFNTLERITKELIQLWENTLYLWLAIALISQRPYYTKLHNEIIVVNSKDFYGDVRYDNFEQGLTETTTLAAIWEKISYLKDTYPECNLCIIPKIRLNNYEHNYYGTEKYPGAILYNRNKDEVSYKAFQGNVLKCSDYADKLTSILDTMEGYKYIQPATDADGYPDTGAGRYHAFIRSEGTIDATFNSNNNSITFNNFILKLFDGGYDVIKESDTSARRLLETITWDSNGSKTTVPSSSSLPSSTGTKGYGRGYYLGDVMSYAAVSLELDYSIQAKNIKLAPIGGPHWGAAFENDSDSLYEMRNPYFNGGRWDIVGQADDEVKNHLRDQNMYILNQYYNQKIKGNNTGENITLLVASRNCDLYLTSNFCDQWLDSDVQSNITKRNKLISTNLGGYWYLNGSTITQAPDIYDGKYYESYPQSGGTYDNEIIRYTKVGKIVNNSGLDTMETIRKGYYIKTDGSPDADGNGKIIRLNNTDFRSTSSTEDVINTTVVPSQTITYHLPYRYNNFRQTDYRGAKLIIPGTDKVYNYNNFHHIAQMLPLKDEYPQKSGSLYTNDNDCAAQSVAWDSPDNNYGRKRYIQNYSYTFCRRGEVPSGDNWFMLYIQVVGTFRPFDKYFSCIPFDTINDDFQLYTLFMQSGFSPLSGLSGQANFNPKYTEASESLPIDDYSNKALSSVKEQYLLRLSESEQNELARKENNDYVYTDGDKPTIRYGFSNVTMSTKKAESEQRAWHNVQVCEELAKAIYAIETNGWSATSYNTSDEGYKKYLKPATAGAWLANNILEPASGNQYWKGRTIKETNRDKILNMTGSNGKVKDNLWNGGVLYEKMYPTISQVRCHLFIPRASNNYARYEKYCVNDYGQIMAQWTEKAAINAPLWGQYANVLNSITNDIDSSYVRYDNNKYYFDFFHDPHRGRPDNPFPNKATVG